MQVQFKYLAPNTHMYPSAHVKSQIEVESFGWIADRDLLARLVKKVSALRGETAPEFDSVTVTLYEDREFGDSFCLDYKADGRIQTFFRVSKDLVLVTGLTDWGRYDQKTIVKRSGSYRVI